jgi:hypothetical protein
VSKYGSRHSALCYRALEEHILDSCRQLEGPE